MPTQEILTKRPFRASAMQRAWLCPPAPWREAAMPETPAGPAAAEGTMLHAAVVRAYRHGDYSGLEDEQRGAVRACVRFLESVAQDALPEGLVLEEPTEVLGHDLDPIIDREVTPDVVVFKPGGLAVVVDWKFGRAEPQFEAGRDLQLLTYAIAVRNGYEDISRVHVYRFHPRLWDERRETCVAYEGDAAYWIDREQVLRRIVADSTPDAPARPGTAQCRYCKAKLVCEEFKQWAEPAPGELPAPVNESLTPVQLSRILAYRERLKLLTSMMSDAEELTKKALAQGIDVPGWTLKQGSGSRQITDLLAAKRALSPHLPPEAFDSACKVSVTTLEKVFKSATGMKGKAASEAFGSSLAGLIEMKPSAPSLAPVKA